MAMLDAEGQLFTTAFGMRDRMTAFGRRPETYGELGAGKEMWTHHKRLLAKTRFDECGADGDRYHPNPRRSL